MGVFMSRRIAEHERLHKHMRGAFRGSRSREFIVQSQANNSAHYAVTARRSCFMSHILIRDW